MDSKMNGMERDDLKENHEEPLKDSRLILKSEKGLEARKRMYLLNRLMKLINTINRFYRNVSIRFKQRHNAQKRT